MEPTTNTNASMTPQTEWQQFGKSRLDVIFVCGLLAMVPLVVLQAINLWTRPHFQFFPLAWAAFAWFVYLRGSLSTTHTRPRKWVAISLALLSIACLILATLWYSPWMAHVGLILLCLAWMFVRLGGTAWYLPVAWCSLLLVTLPLPMNLDERLVQSLQIQSSDSASALLDLCYTPHLALGNIIEIRSGKLFVDQACSGVDSLYSLMAVALLLTIWQGRGLLLSLLTFATVPLWAWLGNLVRIFVIAIVFDRFGIDWTHGWQHTLLGLLVFAISCFCLLTTLNGVSSLLSPFPAKTISSGPFHVFFNRTVCWPGKDPASQRPSQRGNQVAEAGAPSNMVSRRMSLGLSAIFLVLGGTSLLPLLGVGPWKNSAIQASAISVATVESTLVEELLPESIEGMRRVGFAIEHRERDSFFGEHSAIWSFEDGGGDDVVISLDFPFPGFHALQVCYELSGSQVLGVVNEHVLETEERDYIYDADFVDQFGETSYLCYTEFDSSGASEPGQATLERGLFKPAGRRAIFQLQIYVSSLDSLTDEQKSRFHNLLIELKSKLLPSIRQLEQ